MFDKLPAVSASISHHKRERKAVGPSHAHAHTQHSIWTTSEAINKIETISLTGAHSITQLVSISAFLAHIGPVAITANAGFIAVETRKRSFIIDAEFVDLGARLLLDALVDVEASLAVLHEPAALAFCAALRSRSGTAAVAGGVALRAQQFALVLERFIEALTARVTVVTGVAFITITLAVALAGSVAFANSISRAVGAGQAVFAEVARWAAGLQGIDAEPLEEI